MPTPQDSRDTAVRWVHWQAPRVSQRSLTPRAAAQGSPLLQGPPPLHAAWCTVVALFQARVPLHRAARGAQRTHGQDLEETWTAWPLWTRRCAASLARLAAGQDGSLPPGPESLVARAGLPSFAAWQQQGTCRW